MARFPELSGQIIITPVPVIFGALLKHWGQLGPAEIPPKRQFVYRFFKWQADRLGLPFKMPPSHPYNPLPSLRLCVAAGAQLEHVQAIFDVIYGRGLQPDGSEAIAAMADALGIVDAPATLADPLVKSALRLNTEQAIADAVFGVPSFVVDGELFWGGDASDMMLDYLSNPALFQSAEMRRISAMPMGIERK
jgi:2-hydroxychromene-2-carboxylate isomerase